MENYVFGYSLLWILIRDRLTTGSILMPLYLAGLVMTLYPMVLPRTKINDNYVGMARKKRVCVGTHIKTILKS